MTQNFIVSVPGRSQPLCIAADSHRFAGGGVTFYKSGQLVAVTPTVDLVANADCLPDFPGLSQFQVPEARTAEPICLGAVAEPGEALELQPSQAFTSFHRTGSPSIGPFLAGFGLGLVGAFGLVLSLIGVR